MPCFEGTRTTLLTSIGRWMSGSLSGSKNPPLYVLDGIAGIGKSTVAITVAQRAADLKCLGATFLFTRDQENRRTSQGFVHTIAYQLARSDMLYGEAIATAIDNNPDALDKVLAQQFNLLVARPLDHLLKKRVAPLVLVFDALDECVESDASEILDLIIVSISKLPKVKVSLTTRPELWLRSKYTETDNANVFHLQDIEGLIVEQDILLYVDYSLSPVKMKQAFGDSYDPAWKPTKDEKAQLAQQSGKLFIFASTAIKFRSPRGKKYSPQRITDVISSGRHHREEDKKYPKANKSVVVGCAVFARCDLYSVLDDYWATSTFPS